MQDQSRIISYSVKETESGGKAEKRKPRCNCGAIQFLSGKVYLYSTPSSLQMLCKECLSNEKRENIILNQL